MQKPPQYSCFRRPMSREVSLSGCCPVGAGPESELTIQAHATPAKTPALKVKRPTVDTPNFD